MKILSLLLFLLCIFLTGCHTCPPPEESMQCFPMCCEDKEETHLLTRENWEKFKKFHPIPYIPVGIRIIDGAGLAISNLSIQVAKEVVIPYVDLDNSGMLATYYEFVECTKKVAEKQQCDTQKAAALVWADWQKHPEGVEMCNNLKKALPFIYRMRASNQIPAAAARLTAALLLISLDLNRNIIQLKRELNTTEGIIKVSIAGANVAANVTYLSIALAYMNAFKSDQQAQNQEIEKFIKEINI